MPAEQSEQIDESEPPFRKAGLFDPYSDDPRLAVKKIAFCPKAGRLIVGGTAGQIVIAHFINDEELKVPIKVSSMNLVSDRDGFVWKGHDQLNVRAFSELEAETIGDEGVHITGILQVLPPASITCLALEAAWGLVAGGTAHGLVLFDFNLFLPVFHRCTLNPNGRRMMIVLKILIAVLITQNILNIMQILLGRVNSYHGENRLKNR